MISSLVHQVINCKTVVGRGTITLKISEFIVNKLVMQYLDGWSAFVLQAPGIWLAVKKMSKYTIKTISSIGVA